MCSHAHAHARARTHAHTYAHTSVRHVPTPALLLIPKYKLPGSKSHDILEVFLFGKRENLSENIKNIIQDIKENPNDNSDDLSDIIIPNDELNAFAISNCDCALCKTMNSIYDKWNAFQPSSNIEKIMKKHIDTMDEEDWDDTSSDDESSSDED